MTTIAKPVTRRTRNDFVRYGPDKLPLVVTIEPLGPEDFVHVRLLRRRQGYRISVPDLYAMLLRRSVDCARMEKLRSRIGIGKRKVKRK